MDKKEFWKKDQLHRKIYLSVRDLYDKPGLTKNQKMLLKAIDDYHNSKDRDHKEETYVKMVKLWVLVQKERGGK